MKLEFARLKNFRQFCGEQNADFSTFDDLNVTVFHGGNGAGKTSFFSAINWCLYNAGVEDIGELVCREALAKATEGEIVSCSVQIAFLHEGSRYVAQRILEVKKVGSTSQRVNTDYSMVRIRASGDQEDIPNPVGYMNAILPANVRPYFFFDGEKMDDLTRADNEEVEEAIRNIMRLPALEKAEDHLNDIAREFRREVKKQGSAELEDLIAKEESLREQKENTTARLGTIKEEIRLARQHIEDINKKLRDSEEARGLQKRRDQIQAALEKLEERNKDIVDTIQELANRSYIRLLTEPAKKALTIIDEKREKGEIPSDVREQLIRDLLENLKCICGRPFEKDDSAYRTLSTRLNRTTSSKLEDTVNRLGGNLRSLSNLVSAQMTSINTLAKERAENKITIEQLYGELDDIRRKLSGVSEEEIAGLEKTRARFQNDLEMNLAEMGRLENQIESLEKRLDQAIKEKRKAEAKENKITFVAKKEELAQRAAEAVAKIKEEFFEETRKEIEAATKQVFDSLAWKQEHFQDITLDRDFRLEVIDRWGSPTRKELSAGERQILSLSFITAMSRLSGEEAPLVMDTPFGRLSGNHLSAVAENLPNLTPQLILFVTDREWDEASRTKLEPRAGAQYVLDFNKKSGCTEIREEPFL
jgi:DNA sulfur modification protein DndD